MATDKLLEGSGRGAAAETSPGERKKNWLKRCRRSKKIKKEDKSEPWTVINSMKRALRLERAQKVTFILDRKDFFFFHPECQEP